MKYIDVKWNHGNEEYPIRLVSELALDGYEIRKLEFFRSGSVGFAHASGTALGVELGTTPVPALDEINALGEFEGKEICASDFEALWTAAVS